MCNFIGALNGNSDALTAIAALIGAAVAVYGVNEWKRQFTWRVKYDTARRYVRALYNVREAINLHVRNPAVSLTEISDAEQVALVKGSRATEAEKRWIVYLNRWQKVDEMRKELREQTLEMEVLHGKQVGEAQKDFNTLIGELYGKIWSHFHTDDKNSDSFDYLYNTGNDNFTSSIQVAVEKSEDIARPYLR